MGSIADQPVLDTRSLFAPERASLLDLLATLTPDQWSLPTVCDGWSVHDVVLHLLWVDISNLSRRRDRYFGRIQDDPGDLSNMPTLIAFVNDLNNNWVRGARRMSPQLAQSLLRLTGDEWSEWVSTVDITATGDPVAWAGPDRAPVWLDIAREFTERWIHQQQIRDVVGAPGATDPQFVRPVLSTFAMALPHALRNVEIQPGGIARLTITGEGGGTWLAQRSASAWEFGNAESHAETMASVELDEETAWKLFTRGLSPSQGAALAVMSGHPQIVEAILNMVTVLA